MDAEKCIENEIDFVVEADQQTEQDNIEETIEVPEINPQLNSDVLTDMNLLQEDEWAMETTDKTVHNSFYHVNIVKIIKEYIIMSVPYKFFLSTTEHGVCVYNYKIWH